MFSNFPKLIKQHLRHLPQDDYPVLNSFLFASCWIHFTLDPSQKSMRDVFRRLNNRGINVDISTFSKASKTRSPSILSDLFWNLKHTLKSQRQVGQDELILFPLDSTIVTLTSKLLWQQGYHQVKLFSGLCLPNAEPGGVSIHFGQGHDSQYGNDTIAETPQGGVGIMDRGFCSLSRIQELLQREERFFVMRIKNNMTLHMQENGKCLLGAGKHKVEVRIVAFSDIETQSEYRLATNLPTVGECQLNNQDIGELYRLRWQIELFWKFLKMHLKLNRFITKNVNGIELQIYAALIGYVLLRLVDIPRACGVTMLDKLRYLQSFMCENISYIHWFRRMVVVR